MGIAELPAGAPAAEDIDDALKVAPGAGEVVFDMACGMRPADDHSGLLETPQALNQQRSRYTRQTAVELVEVVHAIEELADD